MQGDCFACYENLVSPSKTLSLPPPPNPGSGTALFEQWITLSNV